MKYATRIQNREGDKNNITIYNFSLKKEVNHNEKTKAKSRAKLLNDLITIFYIHRSSWRVLHSMF